jgi:SAM-dependent methyltransferase
MSCHQRDRGYELEVNRMPNALARRRRWWLTLLLAGVGVTVLLLRRRTAGGRAEGRRWYGFVYRTLYLLGLKIWERELPPPDLVQLVEGGSAPGRALDLGCGTGTDSIYLARHGWEVTGVDMVPKALAIAQRRAAVAGVRPHFVEGDVTRLQDFGIDGGYDVLFDFGCFHTLPSDRRDAYVESVTAAAAPGATFLLFGFKRPPRMAPMQAGLTAEEVRQRFPERGWEVITAEPVGADEIETVAGRVNTASFEAWRYRLRRR